jgi:hypothetical protein
LTLSVFYEKECGKKAKTLIRMETDENDHSENDGFFHISTEKGTDFHEGGHRNYAKSRADTPFYLPPLRRTGLRQEIRIQRPRVCAMLRCKTGIRE